MKFKRILSITLSAMMLLGMTACGKNEVIVDDYASDADTAVSVENTGTDGDEEELKQGMAGTLREFYGDKVSWEKEFSVDGVNFSVNASANIPEKEGMNVFYAQRIDDGKADEDALVKAIFGDTAKKIEELKYTNETDYMPLIYKYRSLVDSGNFYLLTGDPEEISYKWMDDKDLYIHMYEGEFNGVRFGLLLAFDYINNIRTIFMEPVSIREYFPDKDYKSLLIANSNNMAGQPLNMTNVCSESIETITEDAISFLDDYLLMNGQLKVTSDSTLYRRIFMSDLAIQAGSSIAYGIGSDTVIDSGAAMLMFSDADYISTLRSEGERGETVNCSVLAEQQDLYKEYTDSHPENNVGIFEFLLSNSSGFKESIVEPNFENDGYAVFIGSDIFSAYDAFGMNTPNYGIIKYTSKGFYGIDLSLTEVITGTDEDVQLLSFDKVTENFEAELPERFGEIKKGVNSKGIKISDMRLSYTQYSDDESSSEYSYIPSWTFMMYPDGNGASGVQFIVNAMDGSIIDIIYLGEL